MEIRRYTVIVKGGRRIVVYAQNQREAIARVRRDYPTLEVVGVAG